jgi:hypothetical protein
MIGVIVVFLRVNTVIVFSVVERIENGKRYFPSYHNIQSLGRTGGKKLGGGGGRKFTRLFPIAPDLLKKISM